MKISIKHFLLFTFILLEVCSVMAFATATPVCTPVVPNAEFSLKTKITISFTIARRRDCEGFGICDISVSVSGKINSATGSIYQDDLNKSLMVIEIDKARGISAETYKKYFSSGVFLMEDDSPVPSEIVQQLGLTGSKTLVAGKHKIVERNGILFITIPVK